MELFELEKEKKILESKIVSKKERIELERTKLDVQAIDLTKVAVQSSHSNNTNLDVIAKITEMEKDLEYLEKLLEQNSKEVSRLYNIYDHFDERDKQIYIEKKLYKWSNSKISVKHGGISFRQIQRIIEKIKKSIKSN